MALYGRETSKFTMGQGVQESVLKPAFFFFFYQETVLIFDVLAEGISLTSRMPNEDINDIVPASEDVKYFGVLA